MKATDLLKITAVAVFTAGIAVGCASGGSEETMAAEEPMAEECQGATPEVKNAIYAAKVEKRTCQKSGLRMA